MGILLPVAWLLFYRILLSGFFCYFNYLYSSSRLRSELIFLASCPIYVLVFRVFCSTWESFHKLFYLNSVLVHFHSLCSIPCHIRSSSCTQLCSCTFRFVTFNWIVRSLVYLLHFGCITIWQKQSILADNYFALSTIIAEVPYL